ncbi:hypothetical protein NQ152_12040 [Microbacterium sp. zg.B48]|uniref:hypothetical protein n=1 Tax=Microbacterium sp. zg.B48 TaxID=2969408 RepID=UPI00214CAAFF|nr:hypothetical protein [Microbacterium sp. zg.B48]MCR2764234.1 hypothetical protein [Microbacterium sp. zg.B48]
MNTNRHEAVNPQARIVVVTLASKTSAAMWRTMRDVIDVITFDHAAPTGSRFGKRSLGLGLDSVLVAIRATKRRRRVTYLATNPWIGVCLRLLTRMPVVVTGLYATPGTINWNVLRRVLGDSGVITLSTVEASNWRMSGGRATSVVYGNDFPYLPSDRPSEPDTLKIFVGGSSDRDHAALASLESEVLASGKAIELIVAVGGEARVRRAGTASVRHYGQVSQTEFGSLMGNADLTFLPLVMRERAAGHMILVGSLQVGTAVAICGGGGMDGYVDGQFVTEIPRGGEILPYLIRTAQDRPGRTETRAYWERCFSRTAYVRRLEDAVSSFRDRSASDSASWAP